MPSNDMDTLVTHQDLESSGDHSSAQDFALALTTYRDLFSGPPPTRYVDLRGFQKRAETYEQECLAQLSRSQ
jgi:hypothetical protein